jgi:hypothetical protein
MQRRTSILAPIETAAPARRAAREQTCGEIGTGFGK